MENLFLGEGVFKGTEFNNNFWKNFNGSKNEMFLRVRTLIQARLFNKGVSYSSVQKTRLYRMTDTDLELMYIEAELKWWDEDNKEAR